MAKDVAGISGQGERQARERLVTHGEAAPSWNSSARFAERLLTVYESERAPSRAPTRLSFLGVMRTSYWMSLSCHSNSNSSNDPADLGEVRVWVIWG